MAGTLYVVGTPIGNLEDLSPRAARILREVAIVAAEDTRSVQVLLERADLGGGRPEGRRITSVFEGNEAARAAGLVEELQAGKDVALVSEAGMPGISDPGERVVKAAIEAGIEVVVVPGPVAAIAALVASGLPTQPFLFVGFPPREAGARAELAGTLRASPATMIFYEAPDRVGATLATFADGFGEARGACVSRELTKLHEEHVRGTLGALRELLAQGLGPKDVAQRLVVRTGRPRRELYQLALALARGGQAE